MNEEHLIARVLIAFVFAGIATIAAAMTAHLGS
jgi:hypothetical protein